jgi:hypothetical protein
LLHCVIKSTLFAMNAVLNGQKLVGAPMPLLSTNEDGWLFEAENGLAHPPVTFRELAEWAKENGLNVPGCSDLRQLQSSA